MGVVPEGADCQVALTRTDYGCLNCLRLAPILLQKRRASPMPTNQARASREQPSRRDRRERGSLRAIDTVVCSACQCKVESQKDRHARRAVTIIDDLSVLWTLPSKSEPVRTSNATWASKPPLRSKAKTSPMLCNVSAVRTLPASFIRFAIISQQKQALSEPLKAKS